ESSMVVPVSKNQQVKRRCQMNTREAIHPVAPGTDERKRPARQAASLERRSVFQVIDGAGGGPASVTNKAHSVDRKQPGKAFAEARQVADAIMARSCDQ